MTPRLILFIALAGFLSTFHTDARGQCCSAGNPVGGDLLQAGISPKSLRVTSYFKHSFSDQYYTEDHPEEVPQINFSRFNFLSLQFIYGITGRLNAFGELGYFFDKSQSVSIQGDHLLSAGGIGDLALGAKYIVLSSGNGNREFNVSAGAKIPLGVFDQESDGIVLPLSLQPSNGATKFTASLYYLQRHPGSRMGFYLVSSVEMSTTIQSENYYYHYGNVYLNAITGTWKMNDRISLALQTRLELRGRDRREEEQLVASTGSSVVFLSPIAQLAFLKNWELAFQADFPVYKYVRGSQLTNKLSFSLGLSRRFTFHGMPKEKQIN